MGVQEMRSFQIWIMIAIALCICASAQQDPYSRADSCIGTVHQAGLPASRLDSMLRDAIAEKNQLIARGRLLITLGLCNDALESNRKIPAVEAVIRAGESRWIGMHNSKAMLGLAKAAMKREEYTTALDRANQAMTISYVEAEEVNWGYRFSAYWKIWLMLLVLLVACVYLAAKYIKKRSISRKIKGLIAEDSSIMELIREAYHQHYVTKKLSSAGFHKAMYEYTKSQRILRKKLINLRAVRARMFGKEVEIKTLSREKKAIEDQLSRAQKKHLVDKTMSEHEYHPLVHDLHERLAEIEEASGVLIATKKNITTQKQVVQV